MKIRILSSKNYENAEKNYGDCIIVDNERGTLLIYDCGHIKHAERVLDYIKMNNIVKSHIVLSHNDANYEILPVQRKK